jgi:inhibitor of cysteine peptidase
VIALSEACAGGETVRLGSDSGSFAVLSVGDDLQVTLQADPTTGFLWERVAMEGVGAGVLEQVGEADFEPANDALGAGGTVTLRYDAVASGQTVLRLIYHRPFESDAPPIRTLEVTVTVE